MEKFLVTGFSGFVSKHFIEFLEYNKIHAAVLGVDLHQPDFNFSDYKYVKCNFAKADLLNKDEVENIIFQFQPNYILHLASYSSVAFSWSYPVLSFANNTNIFLNLLEKVRALNLNCRILSVGSSEEYGNVSENDLPINENCPLKPVSPYAVARVSQEMLSKVYVEGFGLDIVMTRSFNHIGPGQKDVFVISSFAKQLVEMKKNENLTELVTGDTSIIRDFIDVRDVVKAYYNLFKKGRKGEIYNICSGTGTSLKEIIQEMGNILNINIQTKKSSKLIRPNDNKVIIGCNKKISGELNWQQEIPLKESLIDIIKFWENQ